MSQVSYGGGGQPYLGHCPKFSRFNIAEMVFRPSINYDASQINFYATPTNMYLAQLVHSFFHDSNLILGLP